MLAILTVSIVSLAPVQDAEVSVHLGLWRPATDDPWGRWQAFEAAAQATVEDWNARGPLLGGRIQLIAQRIEDRPAAVRAALESLIEAGCAGVLMAPDPAFLALVRATVPRPAIPLVSQDPDPTAIADAVQSYVGRRFRLTRIGLLHDGSRFSRSLADALEERLTFPYRLVLNEEHDLKPKTLDRRLTEAPPDVLLLDLPVEQAVEALTGPLAGRREVVVLTPRAFGAGLQTLSRPTYLLWPQDPATVPEGGEFCTRMRQRLGTGHEGAVEGVESVEMLLRACQSAGSTGPRDVQKALGALNYRSARGRVEFASKPDHWVVPLAVSAVTAGALQPAVPPVIDERTARRGTEGQARPDADVGDPFLTHRTDAFTLAEDTQWVVFTYGPLETSTIDEDLRLLGLSTGGEVPLLDHLIREELLARILSITATKFLLQEDGGAKDDNSLRISLSTALQEKPRNRSKVWTATVSGDDAGAGGRAWPGEGRCEIYSTFLRRTIFQEHALEPAVGAEDLPFLLGTYRFGTDHKLDHRSDLIRALINGYAGGLGLTAAHEIGHLCGLGHNTDTPTSIMNVEEGAGVDYRDGQFSARSMELLRERLGVHEN